MSGSSKMEALTDQFRTIALSGYVQQYSNTNEIAFDSTSPKLKNSELREGYFQEPRNVPKLRKYRQKGEDVTFVCDGQPILVIKRNWPSNTCGIICAPGLPLKATTSGYVVVNGLPEYQIDNDNGKAVWQMCKGIGYYLAPTKNKEDYKGQYLAVHVEKKLLYYYFTHSKNLNLRTDIDLCKEITGEEVIMVINLKPCFDCMLFCYYFGAKTNTRIQFYYDQQEYMELYRDLLEPLAHILLLEIAEPSDALIFAIFERDYTASDFKEYDEEEQWVAQATNKWRDWIKEFKDLEKRYGPDDS